MARYRAAIIGLGRIAHTIDDEIAGTCESLPLSHMGSYQGVAEVEVVAGADTFAEQREVFGRRWGIARVYADYREMIARERPDIISICTSAKPRARIVVDVAHANSGVRAIWAEKPIALSLAEADAMIDACRVAGTKLAVDAVFCWDPLF